MAGIMHRVTPDHYNLYNEEETLIGALHRIPSGYTSGHSEHGFAAFPSDAWYGHHVTGEVTGTHPTRHHAAREMMERHEALSE